MLFWWWGLLYAIFSRDCGFVAIVLLRCHSYWVNLIIAHDRKMFVLVSIVQTTCLSFDVPVLPRLRIRCTVTFLLQKLLAFTR